MAKTRYGRDLGLNFRMGTSMFLLGLLYVVLILAIWFLMGRTVGGVVLALVISVGLFWGQWYFSDKLAMRAMNARVVSPQQAPELHTIIDRLCQLADMKKPVVAISNSDMPNAFATGRSPEKSVVCVTSGLLTRLSGKEVEAVLSHELSHVAHRDVTVMTIAGISGVLAGLMMRSWMFMGGRRDNNQNGIPIQLIVVLVGVVVYALSFLLIRVLSRYRELAADRSGAYLTGNPSELASALVKVSGEMGKIPTKDLRKVGAYNQFFLVPALHASDISKLFSTHPPLDKRLEQLSKISAELGQQR
ncbi:zinc metalloprotease HtpX [Spelaeicoccus albus]|uniref:Protease HtpX homolog n=1 Tax=Spelaeicoccus albus TaxID=1280376 RepID=A0A7Z0AB47_9MICO|nr:zinc metalloprotease HtpX [Spelaeicoccus albus]NYI65931.1 heat shock protein HtpX [Spelaeicoccus albus]